MDFTELQADPTAEENGTWCEFAPGVSFLIASATSKRYRRAIAKQTQREASGLRRNDVEALDRATIRAMAKALVLDWKGDVKFKGEPLSYTQENAETLLKIPAFRDWVATQANDLSNFRAQQEEEATATLKSGDAVAPEVGRQAGVA